MNNKWIKSLLSLIAVILLHSEAHSQILSGIVVNSKTKEPLEYVSIGVIDSNFGATTDESGQFNFNIGKTEKHAKVRFSMIGFDAQIFPVEVLIDKDIRVELVEKPLEISELTVTPLTERKVGADGFSRLSGWSGWGGYVTRRGFEMGLIVDLGETPKLIKDINIYIHRQAFDTTVLRLHIRSIEDKEVSEELLQENILINVTNESGWAKADLSPYHLFLCGEVGVTVEWIKSRGINKDRTIKIDDRKQESYVLFKNEKKQVGLYRWGTEAKWIINNEKSPSLYLTVLE
jgi:hypothetical protein